MHHGDQFEYWMTLSRLPEMSSIAFSWWSNGTSNLRDMFEIFIGHEIEMITFKVLTMTISVFFIDNGETKGT